MSVDSPASSGSAVFGFVKVDAPRNIPRTLAAMRHGRGDPTTQISSDRGSVGQCWHATITPDGPGTLRLTWRGDVADDWEAAGVDASGYGPGGDWLVGRAAAMLGEADRAVDAPDAPDVVRRALRNQRTRRLIATGNAYHQLLPVVLAQRITADQAIRQWHRLVERYGAPAPAGPGMPTGLRTPPAPDALVKVPSWEFHRLGIEQARARTLVNIARHAQRIAEWSAQPYTSNDGDAPTPQVVSRPDRAATKLAATKPATTGPAATKPATTGLATTRPATTRPAGTDPLGSNRSPADAPPTEPPPAQASLMERLQLLSGVGPWTAASVTRVVAGDPDAVIVGDFHFPHAVSTHLTGRPRSDDDEMVALLAPYEGQRGRVQAALVALGAAPAFGPRRRIIAIERF